MSQMDQQSYNKLLEVCAKNDLEIMPYEGELLIVGARKPSKIVQNSIEALMAGHKIQFVESFKQSSVIRLREIFTRAGAMAFSLGAVKRDAEVKVQGPIDKSDIPEAEVSEVMLKDGFFESWTVTLNGETIYKTSAQVIRACEGHNVREQCISKDDILNLEILLGQCQSVDDLLRKL